MVKSLSVQQAISLFCQNTTNTTNAQPTPSNSCISCEKNFCQVPPPFIKSCGEFFCGCP